MSQQTHAAESRPDDEADRPLVSGEAVLDLGSEEQLEFAAIFKTMPVVLFIHQGGTFRYVNPAAETILGYSRAELLRMDFWEVIHHDYREAIRSRGLRREQGEPVPPRSEFPIVSGQGELRWLDCSATTILFQGRPAVLGSALDITKRVRAEEELRESHQRFRQLAEKIHEVFWITNPARDHVLYVSPGYETIWGRSCASLIKSPREWNDAIHEEDRPRVTHSALENQAQGAYEEVYRIVRPDGSVRWIKDKAFPVRDDSGRVYRIVGIAEDITQEKQAGVRSARLAALAQQLSIASTPHEAARNIVDAAQEILGWDACYLHLYADPDTIMPVLTMDLVNGKPAEISATTFTSDPSPMMRKVTSDGPQLVNRQPQPTHADDLVRFGDQSRPSASMMYVPIWRLAKAVGVLSIQSYTPNAYDADDLQILQALADQCAGALARIRASEQLRASEARNRALVEAIPDVILRIRGDGTIVHISVPAEQTALAASLHGGSISEILPPAIVGLWKKPLDLALRTGQVQTLEFQLPNIHGDRNMEARVVPCGADEVLAIMRDVTDVHRLQKEVMEISAREQRRIGHNLHDGFGQFLAGFALKAKVLEQNLAQESPAHEAAARELAQLARSAVNQARSLARGLDPIEVELTGLIPALEHLAADTAQLYSVACFFQSTHENVPVSPFAGVQLYRIIQEAIMNAVTHGRARHIDIMLSMDDGELSVQVQDDGAGFDTSDVPGSGMGLRIIGYRARCVGGRLEVHSQPGAGTTLCCALSLSAGNSRQTNEPEPLGAGI